MRHLDVVWEGRKKRGSSTYELTRSMLFMLARNARYGVLETAVRRAVVGPVCFARGL
jgi:hypothetical protein